MLGRAPALAVAADLDAAAAYSKTAYSEATKRAYRADWADFTGWCARAGVAPLPAPPEMVAAYLSSLAATHGRSSLRRRLAAIGQAHQFAGQSWTASHPAIRTTLRGILRRHGTPSRQAAALTTADIRRLVAVCDGGLTGIRDRAMLLVGFAGALRRSELVGIDREHITLTHEGLRLLIPRAKTDPEGEGTEIGLPRGKAAETCPVRALRNWLEISGTAYGPVFRKIDKWGTIETGRLCPEAVRQILRRRAAEAGITVPAQERLSPHGLRAGFITQAYKEGARDEAIMGHTRHADLKTMRRYVRRAKLMEESPVKLLGL